MFKNFISSTALAIFTLCFFIALVFLNYQVWNKDASQEKVIEELRQELAIQRATNEKTHNINENLRQKISSLKKGSYEMIEEEARDNFGMVGEGETFYHFKTDKDNTQK